MISQSSRELLYGQFLSHITPQSSPKLYATCGIPGAGKSYFVDIKLDTGDFPTDAYILNPDRLMVALPEYMNDAEKHGAQTAYETWELPVRDLAYQFADETVANKGNIIKDMGCANPLSLDLIKRAKSDGYHITMFYIYCDSTEAFRRINQRDFQISQTEVIDRLNMLGKLIPDYKEIADEFLMLDNSDVENCYLRVE